MERKAMKKQMKLAASFFLLTVLLRSVSVNACLSEDEVCDPTNPDCCDGLECVEVSPGDYRCKLEACEDHEDHSCKVHERECCDGGSCKETLACVCDVDEGTCKNCTDKLRKECDPTDTNCCERRAECVDLDGDGTHHCECRQKGCENDCDCCVNAVCTTNPDDGTKECICRKQEDDPCDHNACVPECCERECVQVAVGDFRCKTV